MSVFATVSTSTDSHRRASHMARNLLRSNLSAATSKCCVMGTSRSISSAARPGRARLAAPGSSAPPPEIEASPSAAASAPTARPPGGISSA